MKFFSRFQRKSLKAKLAQLEIELAQLDKSPSTKKSQTVIEIPIPQKAVEECIAMPQELMAEKITPSSKAVPEKAELIAQKDDLTKIKGIGAVTAGHLNELGFYTYEQIANLSSADLVKIDAITRFTGQVAKQDWIGQANRLK